MRNYCFVCIMSKTQICINLAQKGVRWFGFQNLSWMFLKAGIYKFDTKLPTTLQPNSRNLPKKVQSLLIIMSITIITRNCPKFNYKTFAFISKFYAFTIYTERQKKLITSSWRRSLKSTATKLIIFGHK